MPPNIPLFDMANKAPFLHLAHKVQSYSQPPLSLNPAPDINLLTSVLLLQTLASSGLLPCAPSTQAPSLSTQAPSTPVHHVVERTTSPPLPSPPQLSQFLKHAETEPGVTDAMMYEKKLLAHHIGPDIFGNIDDKTLLETRIPTGDIICLKRGCTV